MLIKCRPYGLGTYILERLVVMRFVKMDAYR